MGSKLDSYVQLIKDLREGQILDDTDPSNIPINKFSTPFEDMALADVCTQIKWPQNLLWAGNIPLSISRSTVGTNSDGSQAGVNMPRVLNGSPNGGPGIYVEESSTQMINNSDFMSFGGTSNMISDNLNSGQAWTIIDGSFTFFSGVATSTANGALMEIGNGWQPTSGYSITAQVSFTLPNPLPNQWGNSNSQDISQYYTNIRFQVNPNTYIELVSDTSGFNVNWWWNGVNSPSLSYGTTWTAGNSYTWVVSYDGNALSYTIYNGIGTGGSVFFATETDTNIGSRIPSNVGFSLGLGGINGLKIQGITMKVPYVNSWNITQAYASYDHSYLIGAAPNGLNAVSIKLNSYNNGGNGWFVYYSNNLGTTDGNTYTWGLWAKADSNCTVLVQIANSSGQYATAAQNINLTTQWQFFTGTGVIPTGGSAGGELLYIWPATGIRNYFAMAQVEQKSYPTSHIRNDALSTLLRAVEGFTTPSPNMSISQGTVAMWVNFIQTKSQMANVRGFLWSTGPDSQANGFDVVSGSGNIYFRNYYNGSNNQAVYALPANISGWNHFAFTWSGTAMLIYFNGVQVASAGYNSGFTLQSTLGIGCQSGGGSPSNAAIADFTVYTRALASTEIQNDYASVNFPVDSSTVFKLAYANNYGNNLFNSAYTLYQSFAWSQGGLYK